MAAAGARTQCPSNRAVRRYSPNAKLGKPRTFHRLRTEIVSLWAPHEVKLEHGCQTILVILDEVESFRHGTKVPRRNRVSAESVINRIRLEIPLLS